MYPEDSTWKIRFELQQSSKDFISEIWNLAVAVTPIDLGIFTTMRDVIQELRGENDVEVVESRPTLVDLSYCIDSQEETVDGYYYYATDDVMVSTYCLPAYDTCGAYQYNVDSLDLYYRQNGVDASCVNLTSNAPAEVL